MINTWLALGFSTFVGFVPIQYTELQQTVEITKNKNTTTEEQFIYYEHNNKNTVVHLQFELFAFDYYFQGYASITSWQEMDSIIDYCPSSIKNCIGFKVYIPFLSNPKMNEGLCLYLDYYCRHPEIPWYYTKDNTQLNDNYWAFGLSYRLVKDIF